MIRVSAACCLAAALAGCSSAPTVAPSKSTSPAITAGAWPVPDSAAFEARIGPPPKPGSAAQRRDIEEVLALQKDASPERIARAQRTLNLTVFTFEQALGPEFTPERYPETAKFFHRLNDLVREVNDPLKAHYQRPHPFEADPRIRRLVDAPAKYSYPSYHSARCTVFWRVLTELDHGKAAAFHAIALEVEKDRVFAGEHFPTDIAAGRVEGHLIFNALRRDPAFRADLARLKTAEWTPPPQARRAGDAVRKLNEDVAR